MTSTRERALITGASAGIGTEFAERLAAAGYDLILSARRRDRLESLAERLRKETGVEIEVIVADLADDDDRAELERAAAADDGLTMLINNAGFGGYRPFVELDPDVAEGLIDVHVTATVRLTRAVLPGMVARNRGSIINVASMLAYSAPLPSPPLPYRVVYAAAKSFMVTFTEILAKELAGTNVRAMVCCPGTVKTEFHEVQGMDMSDRPRMTSAQVVTAALRGLELGEVVCIPVLEDASALDRLNESQLAILLANPLPGSPPPELASRYR